MQTYWVLEVFLFGLIFCFPLMKETKQDGWWFGGGKYNEEKYREDKELVLDFYRQLNHHLGGAPKMRKTELFLSIQHHIRDYVKNKKKLPLAIIDESHLLANDNLAELQIILNFEMDSQDPLIVILCGQSHLRDRFHRPIHESINQRFRIKFHMTPLSREEVKDYVVHHFNLVGRKDPPFNEAALDALYQNTAGNPRKINLLALKTLTLGAIEKKRTLTEEEIFKASREL